MHGFGSLIFSMNRTPARVYGHMPCLYHVRTSVVVTLIRTDTTGFLGG